MDDGLEVLVSEHFIRCKFFESLRVISMIIEMRKQLKSMPWLWIFVAISMASFPVFFKAFYNSSGGGSVGTINGAKILKDKFRQVQIQEQLYRAKLASFGFDQFAGPVDLKTVLKICARDSVLDLIGRQLSLSVNDDILKKDIADKFGAKFADENGVFNVAAYKRAVHQSIGTPVEEFEEEQRSSMERSAVTQLVKASAIKPKFVDNFENSEKKLKKNFKIISMPFSHFEDEVKKEDISDATLRTFYAEHKKDYMTDETRSVRFANLKLSDFEQDENPTEYELSEHYDRFKNSRYLAKPKFRIRHARFSDIKTDEKLEKAKATAKIVLDRMKSDNNENDLSMLARFEGKKAGIKFDAEFTEDRFELENEKYPQNVEKAIQLLRDKNDVSGVILADDGIHIVQLFERTTPAPKAFKDVKNEIEKLLLKRKVAYRARAEIEKLSRSAYEDPESFKDFVKERGLEMNSATYSQAELKIFESVKNSLVKHIFDWKRDLPYVGYISTDDGYTVFSLDSVKKAEPKKLDEVKTELKSAYIEQEAIKRSKKLSLKLKRDVLSKNLDLNDLAKEHEFKLMESGLMAHGDTLKKPSNAPGLLDEALKLTSGSQALLFSSEKDFFLVKLAGEEKNDEKDSKNEEAEYSKDKIEDYFLEGFIASLLRDAKIELSSKEFGPVDDDY